MLVAERIGEPRAAGRAKPARRNRVRRKCHDGENKDNPRESGPEGPLLPCAYKYDEQGAARDHRQIKPEVRRVGFEKSPHERRDEIGAREGERWHQRKGKREGPTLAEHTPNLRERGVAHPHSEGASGQYRKRER